MTLTQEPTVNIGSDIDVARALYDRGDYKEAHALAMRIFADHESVEVKLRALLTASACRSEQKRYADALTTLNLGGELLDDVGPVQKAKFFGQRAYLHTQLKDDENVLIDYAAARMYAEAAGDKVIEAQARNNMAGCYRRLKRYEESIAESDAAINVVRRSGDRLWLARFYDQKAQTLLEMVRYEDAAALSRKAVEMLGDHPSGFEARMTYGRALILLGAYYLETDDPVETFCSKRQAARSIDEPPSPELIQLALDRVDGRVSKAAQLLGVSYTTLIESIDRYRLTRREPQRRARSIILKSSEVKLK